MLAPFSPKAKAFFQREPAQDTFFTLLEGSVRSGKTWAMMVKLLTLNKYRVAGERVIIGHSKATIYNNVLKDLFTFVGSKNYRYNVQTGRLFIYGVQWLTIGVSNEGAERAIRGMTAGIIVWDEVTQAPKNVFDMAMSRLSPAGARFYGTTNPDTPFHYLVTDYLERPEFKSRVTRIPFFLEDNYSLSEEKRQDFRTMFKGVFYQRNILGMWVAAEGAIYGSSWNDVSTFDDSTMPIGLTQRGGYAQRFVAVDYGTTNPCVYLDIYDDGTTAWVVREYYYDSKEHFAQLTDSQYGDAMDDFLGGPYTDAQIVIDPSAASFRAELTQRGYMVAEADNDVLNGIRMVSTMLGNRTLRFHRDKCLHTIREMQSYSWDSKSAERTGEEKPIKKNDHGPDAVRYFAKTMMPEWRLQIAA